MGVRRVRRSAWGGGGAADTVRRCGGEARVTPFADPNLFLPAGFVFLPARFGHMPQSAVSPVAGTFARALLSGAGDHSGRVLRAESTTTM